MCMQHDIAYRFIAISVKIVQQMSTVQSTQIHYTTIKGLRARMAYPKIKYWKLFTLHKNV